MNTKFILFSLYVSPFSFSCILHWWVHSFLVFFSSSLFAFLFDIRTVAVSNKLFNVFFSIYIYIYERPDEREKWQNEWVDRRKKKKKKKKMHRRPLMFSDVHLERTLLHWLFFVTNTCVTLCPDLIKQDQIIGKKKKKSFRLMKRTRRRNRQISPLGNLVRQTQIDRQKKERIELLFMWKWADQDRKKGNLAHLTFYNHLCLKIIFREQHMHRQTGWFSRFFLFFCECFLFYFFLFN